MTVTPDQMMSLEQAKTLQIGDAVTMLFESIGADGNDVEREYPAGARGVVAAIDTYGPPQGYALTIVVGTGDESIVAVLDEGDCQGRFPIAAAPRTLQDYIDNCDRYAEALSVLEICPNGDDFNNLLLFLSGARYFPPHVTGR